MSTLYALTGSSKQALHQFLLRQSTRNDIEQEAILLGNSIRAKHPRMGCRTMYELMPHIDIGRDRCERILLSCGFRVRRKVNYIKTTLSQRIYQFPDLIKGLVLTRINQVWQTDITYYLTAKGRVFYITFIEDVYSRRILSWQANDHLKSEANLACLKGAIKLRRHTSLKELIHHSDHGSQYTAIAYLDLLKKHSIRISMCKQAWQNAYTERINGTIKNNYLYAWEVNTLAELRSAVKRAVDLYNLEKPHKNLPARMSPITFETYLLSTEKKHHPRLKIFDYEE